MLDRSRFATRFDFRIKALHPCHAEKCRYQRRHMRIRTALESRRARLVGFCIFLFGAIKPTIGTAQRILDMIGEAQTVVGIGAAIRTYAVFVYRSMSNWVNLILIISGLVLIWFTRSKTPSSIPTGPSIGGPAQYGIILEEPKFLADAKAFYRSKLVLSLTNSADRPIHFFLPSWTCQVGDIGTQNPFKCGYWTYPPGKTRWIDTDNEPLIRPNERFHIWIGLDATCTADDLERHRIAKRLGTLHVPIEIEGEHGQVTYRL
jgi:hypothetical protein